MQKYYNTLTKIWLEPPFTLYSAVRVAPSSELNCVMLARTYVRVRAVCVLHRECGSTVPRAAYSNPTNIIIILILYYNTIRHNRSHACFFMTQSTFYVYDIWQVLVLLVINTTAQQFQSREAEQVG